MKTALSFDDVLLVPKTNQALSRDEVSLGTAICGYVFNSPIIAANMPSVCGREMAYAMNKLGGLGIVHRMQSIEEQADQLPLWQRSAAAVGIGEDYIPRATRLHAQGASILCIDVAHGDQKRVQEVTASLLRQFTDIGVIVGNFATAEGVKSLLRAISSGDCDRVACKMGVGGGSLCTTRMATGFGVPTLQSIMDASHLGIDLIADGGIRNSGDIVKCLAAGAKMVMLGSALAGTDESPGEVIRDRSGRLCKVYRGSASYGEKSKYFGKVEYVEGAETLVDCKGPVGKVVLKLEDGIRSGLTYGGASTIKELQANAEFVQITSAGLKESHPHGLL